MMTLDDKVVTIVEAIEELIDLKILNKTNGHRGQYDDEVYRARLELIEELRGLWG